jgi:hypothetical protein
MGFDKGWDAHDQIKRSGAPAAEIYTGKRSERQIPLKDMENVAETFAGNMTCEKVRRGDRGLEIGARDKVGV